MTKTADKDFSRQWFGPYNREKPKRILKILARRAARRRLNRIHFKFASTCHSCFPRMTQEDHMTRKLPPLPPGARPATDDEILRFLIWDGYVNIISPHRANGTWVGGDRVSKRLYTLGRRRDYYVIDHTFVSRLNGANVGLHHL